MLSSQTSPSRVTIPPKLASVLQVTPMALVFLALVIVPLGLIFVVSFLDYNFAQVFPELYLETWVDVLTSDLTLALYLKTFKFLIIVWAITAPLGFAIAYFLAFHLRSNWLRTLLVTAIAIPFWTSGPIRMVSWVPLLGREGVVNQALLGAGVIDEPLGWLMYSEFAVLVAYVQMLTMPMIATALNSMAKIPPSVIQAAQDAGASEWQIVRDIIFPLVRPGLAIGTIIVTTAIMGDVVMVKFMGGSQVNTVGMSIITDLNAFMYPPAAAKSILLLVVVLSIVVSLLRFADIRKELRN
ncbi:ABC transporter permease [Alloyangia pacifica]|uniref:Putative spermidine/putrescine transport system permease protein n=1 Tax=Alloyangia pacifica TaxID=311180 RepID=A0A1I6QZE8_9RHOB|nr:ABC transporter permease [Alloyangia pacifica]SDG07138.1 putative spermidine/putrescine transport system permease protein [Alloyangia pacifica]SFS57775.1 putative spermidine/putrescine transport system permease protein [Alloyangia pacifica]